ncbi:MAG: YidC/Oxa1 family membrane protein insertase [bacterium]
MFHTIFYEPVLNLLVFLYNNVPGHDIGIAIVLLTIVIKLILWPLSGKALKSQKAMQTLQPKMEEIKAKFKDNKEAMSKAMMELYKVEKINPFSSCLPLLIQLPFFWAVFQVFRNELVNEHLESIYSFVSNPGTLNPVAFGLINLSEPNIALALLAGAAQFGQAKLMPKTKPTQGKEGNMMSIMGKQMMYFMPILTIFICMSLPSGLALYWFLTTLLTIFQQMYMFKKNDKEVVESA